MLILTSTRNGNLLHEQTFEDYDMANYFFLVEANRAYADPSVTVTLSSGHNALKMISNSKIWESELYRAALANGSVAA